MKKENEEYKDFERFKQKATKDNNYYISIFYNGNIETINISEYRKKFLLLEVTQKMILLLIQRILI